jgi:hypothetical protein
MAKRTETRSRTPWQLLHAIEQMKHQRVESRSLDPDVALLRRWQSQRLTRTYADLLAHSRFRPACEFFLEDLYGPKDFAQRDHDMAQVYDFARRFVPDALIRPLTVTVELHFLSLDLDAHLLSVLQERFGLTETLTVALYAEAYRLCNNYSDRVRQIEMVSEIGDELDRIAKIPLVGTALHLARGPAIRAGWVELTEFLERGYRAFEHMRGAQFFTSTIRQRERRILDKIFAGDADPFGFELEEARK